MLDNNVFALPAAVAVAIRQMFLWSFVDCCKESGVHISVD